MNIDADDGLVIILVLVVVDFTIDDTGVNSITVVNLVIDFIIVNIIVDIIVIVVDVSSS